MMYAKIDIESEAVMAKNIYELYKCLICDSIVEVTHGGADGLVCCGDDMTLLEPKSGPEGSEKHIPVLLFADGKLTVKVGEVPHPMLPEHYIEWIRVVSNEKSQRVFLRPGQAPEATFCLREGNSLPMISIHCNVHGLWDNLSDDANADEQRETIIGI